MSVELLDVLLITENLSTAVRLLLDFITVNYFLKENRREWPLQEVGGPFPSYLVDVRL